MDGGKKGLMILALVAIAVIYYFNFKGNTSLGALKKISIEVNTKENTIKINGKKVGTKHAPYEVRDTAMLPLPDLIGSLGGNYHFDKEKNCFSTDYNNLKINAYINNNYVFVNNEKKNLDVPPELKDDTVFVSTKFFTEALGFTIQKKQNSIVISKNFVIFGEKVLEDYVREITNKSEGEFTKEELSKIERIEMNGKGIKSLDGIQYFTNLKHLSLRSNKISDILVLKELKSLTELDLSDNFIDKIDPIINLGKLSVLDLSMNKITVIPALIEMRSLKKLDLSKNRIDSASYTMPEGLENLDLSSNMISVLASVTGPNRLRNLYLTYNPLWNVKELGNTENIQNIYIWGISSKKDILRESKIIDSRCTAILQKLDTANKGTVDKMISIYDFILHNFKYKKVDKSDRYFREYSNPIGVLNKGAGTSSGLSQLLSILMSKEGLVCSTYLGNLDINGKKELHAWNIQNASGHYSYTDIGMAYELGVESYGHAFFDISERQFASTHPGGVIRNLGALSDSPNLKRSFVRGWAEGNGLLFDYINHNIVKSEFDNKTSIITEDKSQFVASDGKFVFYRNEDDEGKLYRIDVNGGNKTKINDDQPYYILNDSKNIYYINTLSDNNEKGQIVALSKKNWKKTIISENSQISWIAIKNDTIYHKSIQNGKDKPGLFRVDTDGDSEERVVEDDLKVDEKLYATTEKEFKQGVLLYRDLIFYQNASDDNRIYSIRVTGKSRKKLTEEPAELMEIANDRVYYKNTNGSYRMGMDGSFKAALKIGAY